ncbi:MAG TPA: response regulator [Alphaproteobacteria bacterium]|nr:response regulator [Alphaproteobacteria bacterium]
MTELRFEELRVLVVEDQDFIRSIVVKLLRDAKVGVIDEARDGQTALERMRLSPHAHDVVICDLNMAPMDGFEFIRKVRASRDLPDKTVPVIVLTGHTDIETVLEAQKLDIDSFVAKPVSKKQLLLRIEKAIFKRRGIVPANEVGGL